MSYQSIKEYLVRISSRYQSATKRQKTDLLDEAIKVTGRTRKHLTRILLMPAAAIAKRKASGRNREYSTDLLLPHIKHLWIHMERISAKRMKAAYPDWLPFYIHDEFNLPIRILLEKMSVSTLDRFLRLLRGELKVSRGLSTTTCPARYMKNKVPINTLDAKATKPGFTQADTVAHCGNSGAGAFANTLTLTDIHSTWTENRALFQKKGHEVRRMFADLKTTLPFDLLAINVDSGSEFLNTPMLHFVSMPGQRQITFTRSRPYKKNDNCYVEQKNFTHVRELFGYERIENLALIGLMNDIYKTCWNPLQNYFLPTFKLLSKTRVGARIVKKYDRPQTPYNRLMNSEHLTEEQKQKLKEAKKMMNPFELKRDLENKLKIFFEELRRSKAGKAA